MPNETFKLSIVIPAYNEQGNIVPLYTALSKCLALYKNYEIIFVDDGSSDKTLDNIKDIARSDPEVKYIALSRNFGHQNALKAGLDRTAGDCIITMDADLQHPVELIEKLVDRWRDGYDVIYTVRVNEKNVSLLKRFTSKIFYKTMNALSDTHLQEGTADFRLLDRKVVEFIKALRENYLFLRGIVAWAGFKQTWVEYTPNQRYSGTTKYSLRKMFRFASAGITSFSMKPLRLSIFFGFAIGLAAFVYGIYAVLASLLTNKTVPGWTSVIVSSLFIGGIQLFMMGIIGEYLGKLFLENKRRPNYIVKEDNIEDE